MMVSKPSLSPLHPAVTLAAAIRSGQLRASDLLQEHLARIRASAAALNAVVTLDPKAEQAASQADRVIAEGKPVGPLHGVPFTVKDTIDTAGLRTTAGSPVLADRIPARSATVVQRLQQAGAILIGKTNCSEFAVDIHTSNPLFGDTWNPLNHSRTSGGSSGGEAAAVAAGLSAFGIGTDFGGSIRWPAHCTGICSLRPTIGLVPGTGVLPFAADNPLGIPNSGLLLHRLMTAGPMARSVADLKLLLDVLAGPDGLDPVTVPVPIPDPGQVDLATLGIAWCAGEGSVPVAAEVVEVVRAAAQALEPRVNAVAECRPAGLETAATLFAEARDAEGLPEVEMLAQGSENLLSDFIHRYLARTRTRASFEARLALATRRDALRAQIHAAFNDWPILLLPVASVPAPQPAASIPVDGTAVPWGQIGSCCRAISILGFPVAVVPYGSDREGLPIGIQIVGRPFHDHEVLAVAGYLEHTRNPAG